MSELTWLVAGLVLGYCFGRWLGRSRERSRRPEEQLKRFDFPILLTDEQLKDFVQERPDA